MPPVVSAFSVEKSDDVIVESYAIMDEGDFRLAAQRVQAYADGLPT